MTPGLEAGRNNFLLAVDARRAPAGIAALDLTTGELLLETVASEDLAAVLARYEARELVLPGGTPAPLPLPSAVRTEREAWEFDPELGREDLARTFQMASLDGLGVEPGDRPALGAVGALLRYARELKPGGLPHLARPRLAAARPPAAAGGVARPHPRGGGAPPRRPARPPGRGGDHAAGRARPHQAAQGRPPVAGMAARAARRPRGHHRAPGCRGGPGRRPTRAGPPARSTRRGTRRRAPGGSSRARAPDPARAGGHSGIHPASARRSRGARRPGSAGAGIAARGSGGPPRSPPR